MSPPHDVEYGSPRLSCGMDVLFRMESALGCRGSFAMVNMDDDDRAKATACSCGGGKCHGLLARSVKALAQGFPTGFQ